LVEESEKDAPNPAMNLKARHYSIDGARAGAAAMCAKLSAAVVDWSFAIFRFSFFLAGNAPGDGALGKEK
jgi:hypothetical protein